jgi:hypothetical protein
MREIRTSGSMSGKVETEQGEAAKAPATERAGNCYASPTPPRHFPTLPFVFAVLPVPFVLPAPCGLFHARADWLLSVAMASNKLAQRSRLFDLYSANLALYIPAMAGRCPCPICGNVFDKSAIDAATLQMNLAHIYPEAAGGRFYTLSCCTCNSTIGSRYDAHLAKDHKLAASVDCSVDATVGLEGLKMRVTARKVGDAIHMEEIAKQTYCKARDAIISKLQQGSATFQLSVTGLPENRRNQMALLHSAYLSTYRWFGIEYCFCADVNWISDSLLRTDPAEESGLLAYDVPSADLSIPFESIAFIPVVARTGDGLYSIAVALPSPDPKLGTRVILLPGFGDEGAEDYAKLRKVWKPSSNRIPLSIRTEVIDPDLRLADERFTGYGSSWWDNLKRQF